MMTTLYPINSDKLKALIYEHKGMVEVSYHTKMTTSAIYNTLKRGSVSKQFMKKLENIGIKYEDYKPEEEKEKPVQETMPISETVIVTKTELQLKTIIAQLGELNNNILAMNSLLERIDKDIKVWEE